MRTTTRLNRRTLISAAIVAQILSLHSRVKAQDSTPEASPVDTDGLADQIRSMLAGCDAIFGIMIVDATGDAIFEHNLDLPFVSASLYKLVLIAETLLRIEAGELTLDDQVRIREEFFIVENGLDSYFDSSAIGSRTTIEELLYASGSYSSNTGAQALFSLSSVEALDERAVQLGLLNTFYRLKAAEVADLYAPDPDVEATGDHTRALRFVQSFVADGIVNVTTPRDVCRIFELLRDNALGSFVTSWRFRQILSARVINDRLPALLPAETVVVHKTGNLPGVLHDAGIIETPAGPVVAVAMAQAATDLDQTMSIEQRIGLAAYTAGLSPEQR
jgi:beta-lactamase class A